MTDLGHNQTDKELAALEKRIKAVYEAASKELKVKVDRYFAYFVERDKHQKGLVEAGKITEEQYKQWRMAQMGRGKRFISMRDEAAQRMTEANKVAMSYINDTTPGIYALNYNYSAFTIEQVSGNVGFSLYDEQTVKRLIKDDPTLLPKRRVNAPKDLKWNKKRFTAEITAGILQGEPIGKIADRVENLSDANRKGAIRNARTAVTEAQNAGRQETYEKAEKMGLNLRKRWVATKDNRTRHEHAKMDGVTVGLNDPFVVEGFKMMYPGDHTAPGRLVWNCRCRMRTVEKEGIEKEPRQMRVRNLATGRNELISEMTYEEWYKWKWQQDSQLIETEKKKVKNQSADRVQFEKYKSILKSKAGGSFENFQKIKYSNIERWEFIKLDFARRSKLINHPEMKLPNIERASAADTKFTGYLFNRDNEGGWAKGRAFSQRLGYSEENWERLRSEIMQGARRYPAVFKRNNGHGDLYEQRMILYGEKDNPTNVIVGWIKMPNGAVNLTSAYIKEV